MRIGAVEIGAGEPDRPPYVIAEIGVNHDGAVERALELVDAAASAGAHAVKVQHFETDRLMSKSAKLAAYQAGAGETDPIEMLRRLELSLDDLARIAEHAHEHDIHAIATVFSTELVEPSAQVPWDAFKTASPDVINRPLLEALAETGRPLIVSTGAAEPDEIENARMWLDPARGRLAFLHCISSYPTPPEDAHLRMIADVRRLADGARVGYSDHTTSVTTGLAARHLGAGLLEKHLTYDTSAAGPDHAASLDPDAMREYVRLATTPIDDAERERLTDERMLGEHDKRVLPRERDVRHVSRQSLTTTGKLPAGHALTKADLTIKRPGTGLAPVTLDRVIGRTLAREIAADTPLTEDDLR